MPVRRRYSSLVLLLALASLDTGKAGAQTVAMPGPNDTALSAGRPVPGPVFETPEFTRAVARGTRTRPGQPGAGNWVQHARYQIRAQLDVATSRLTGRETVTYLNRSPDTLRQVAVYLRQNVFAPGSPRREPVPITGGVTLTRVVADVSRSTPSRAAGVAADRVPPHRQDTWWPGP
jgi:hypothetical protein